jgi:hypothetical protein
VKNGRNAFAAITLLKMNRLCRLIKVVNISGNLSLRQDTCEGFCVFSFFVLTFKADLPIRPVPITEVMS